MKARSMVRTQSVAGYRARVREAVERLLFVVLLIAGILILSLENVK